MKRVIISTKSFSDSNAHKQVIIYLNLSSHHTLGCRPMERTNGSYTILYLIAIIISVFTLNRCWSYVGRTGRKQQLSLAGGCWRHGTVAHEIGELFLSFLRQVSKILLLNHSLNLFYTATTFVHHGLPLLALPHSSSSSPDRFAQPKSTVLLHVIFGLCAFY